MTLRSYRARWVLTPEGPRPDTVVDVVDGRIEALRAARPGDPEALEGWLLPGLINAHLHLELSGVGLIPGGEGFMAWGRRLMGTPRPRDAAAERRAAASMVAAGTAAVFDIANGGHTGPALREAGLQGVVQHELLGWSNRTGLEERLAAGRAPARSEAGVAIRPGPHALYSTPPELVVASSGPRDGVPASIHLGEDEGETGLVRDGAGGFMDWLLGLGVDAEQLCTFGHGRSLVQHLDHLGVLGPHFFVVHGVQLTTDDLDLLAERGSVLCLCPRSNRHILGQLPPVDAILASGVTVALGTDSLASTPDLDVLGEAAALAEAFPHVDPVYWLQALTVGGAAALCRPDLGRLVPGLAPGLILLEDAAAAPSLSPRPSVRWLERSCLP